MKRLKLCLVYSLNCIDTYRDFLCGVVQVKFMVNCWPVLLCNGIYDKMKVIYFQRGFVAWGGFCRRGIFVCTPITGALFIPAHVRTSYRLIAARARRNFGTLVWSFVLNVLVLSAEWASIVARMPVPDRIQFKLCVLIWTRLFRTRQTQSKNYKYTSKTTNIKTR